MLSSLLAFLFALIKYMTDDVSLSPCSLSYSLRQNIWQTVVTVKSEDPSFACSEVIKINLPKHFQMQVKPSGD